MGTLSFLAVHPFDEHENNNTSPVRIDYHPLFGNNMRHARTTAHPLRANRSCRADLFNRLQWRRFLASASEDRTVKLWDAHTRRELLTLNGHRGRVICVSFSPDSKLLASSSDDGAVIVWEVAMGKTATRLNVSPFPSLWMEQMHPPS